MKPKCLLLFFFGVFSQSSTVVLTIDSNKKKVKSRQSPLPQKNEIIMCLPKSILEIGACSLETLEFSEILKASLKN